MCANARVVRSYTHLHRWFVFHSNRVEDERARRNIRSVQIVLFARWSWGRCSRFILCHWCSYSRSLPSAAITQISIYRTSTSSIISTLFPQQQKNAAMMRVHIRIVSILKLVGATRKIAKRKILFPFRIALAITRDGSQRKELSWTRTTHKAISDTCVTKGKRWRCYANHYSWMIPPWSVRSTWGFAERETWC